MKISKTQFLNIMKFDYLKWLKSNREEEVIIEFNNNLELDELIELENKQMNNEYVSKLQEDEEEIIKIDDLKLKMLMPYYQELEMISGRAIKNKFGGNIVYSLDTYKQKKFNYKHIDFEFYCFLDGYQEDDETIRIFETKATTSSKFSKFTFKTNDNENLDFFVKGKDNIYYPHLDFKNYESSDYYKKESKLFNKFDEIGSYIYDLLYQKYVIDHAIQTNKKIEYYLVILNHEYVHDGRFDELGKPVYLDNIVRFYNLTSLLNKMITNIEKDINLSIKIINKFQNNQKNLTTSDLANFHFSDIDLSNFPNKNNLLDYTYRHHGFKDREGNKYTVIDLLKMGYRKAVDVPFELLNRSNNEIQRKAIETNKPYYNKEKIKAGINLLKYPIYHLDFESFNAPLPRFKGESPYSQSLFQYSVHIERLPGICNKDQDNYYYLAGDHSDHRLSLLKSMLDVIKPDGGSVLVYNVSFERSRLKELQQFFPEYFNELEDIINRLFDLQHLVEGNTKLYLKLEFNQEEASLYNFYHKDLDGSYSIKKVLPLFSNLSYQSLDVKDGIEAMVTYNSFPTLNKEEFNKEYQALIEYCKQDTWAMFEILNKLREI